MLLLYCRSRAGRARRLRHELTNVLYSSRNATPGLDPIEWKLDSIGSPHTHTVAGVCETIANGSKVLWHQLGDLTGLVSSTVTQVGIQLYTVTYMYRNQVNNELESIIQVP
jgi:hypothetical protein